jgi:hypothetical protein
MLGGIFADAIRRLRQIFLRTSRGVSHRIWKVRGHACWKGVCRPRLQSSRARLSLCTFSAKHLIRIFNDLHSLRLWDVQHLAHPCTQKVLFSTGELESGREVLEDVWARR